MKRKIKGFLIVTIIYLFIYFVILEIEFVALHIIDKNFISEHTPIPKATIFSSMLYINGRVMN